MSESASDPAFSSEVADVYDALLVPMLFEPYAEAAAKRLANIEDGSIREVAAGTGVVTRAMARIVPSTVEITATDLSPSMIERASGIGTARSITWEPADVMALPYGDQSFDAVVCQFGVMFFRPKPAAFAEVVRVLRPGGRFEFSVWDGLEDNEFADVVAASLAALFPDDPIMFVERVPHGYHDADTIRADLRAGGFAADPTIEHLALTSRAATSADVAMAFCLGTPIRGELERRRAGCLPEAVRVATAALDERFGPTALAGRMSAALVSVSSP